MGRLGRYTVPVKDFNLAIEIFYWVRESKYANDIEDATEENVNNCLRELFFAGEHEFSAVRDRVSLVRPRYNLLSYYALRDEFMQTGKISDPCNVFGFTLVPHDYANYDSDTEYIRVNSITDESDSTEEFHDVSSNDDTLEVLHRYE